METLVRMADFFHTSVDYLIDYTDMPHKLEPVTETMLNEAELRMLASYRQLTDSQKETITILMNEFNKCNI